VRFVVIAIIATAVPATMRNLPRSAAAQSGFAFYINVFTGDWHINSDDRHLRSVTDAS
jgi:hypothetical protein